jgi:hypothetical protein
VPKHKTIETAISEQRELLLITPSSLVGGYHHSNKYITSILTFTLNIQAVFSYELLTPIYQNTRRHNLESYSLNQYRYDNIKSKTFVRGFKAEMEERQHSVHNDSSICALKGSQTVPARPYGEDKHKVQRWKV